MLAMTSDEIVNSADPRTLTRRRPGCGEHRQ
jgi:hypothetical protein